MNLFITFIKSGPIGFFFFLPTVVTMTLGFLLVRVEPLVGSEAQTSFIEKSLQCSCSAFNAKMPCSSGKTAQSGSHLLPVSVILFKVNFRAVVSCFQCNWKDADLWIVTHWKRLKLELGEMDGQDTRIESFLKDPAAVQWLGMFNSRVFF